VNAPDKAEEAKKYNRAKIRLRLAGLLFGACYLLLFQAFVSSPLKTLTQSLVSDLFLAFTLYLVIFSLLHYALYFPLHLYAAFLLEHKFELSNQSIFAWLKDDIKGALLSLGMFLVFAHVLYIFLRNFTGTWWVWMAVFWFGVTVIIVRITPIIIIPLFFKYSPVTDALKAKIMKLAEACGVKIIDVFSINLSKKTRKLNAAVVGMGKTRRVLFADNLLREFTDEEVAGVTAHEFAHHKMRHLWKHIAFGAGLTFLSFYALHLALLKISAFLGAEFVYDIKIFPAIMLVLFIAGLLTLPLGNAFSRKLERDADLFALKATGNKEAFISLMRKLARANLAEANPSRLVKVFFYDHPPISERIKLAEDF